MEENNGIAAKIILAVALLAAGAGIWFYMKQPDTPPSENFVEAVSPAERTQPAPTPPPQPTEDEWQGVDEADLVDLDEPTEPEIPLPPLNESDGELLSALAGLQPSARVAGAIAGEDLMRKVVASIDNLTTGEVARKVRAVKGLGTPFAVTRTGANVTLGASNFERYEPVVDFIATLDASQVAALFDQYSPLFDEAYAELGFPDRAFEDRALEVIDHLMEVPQTDGALQLVQPNVIYEFADPQLEGASAGHKLLLRMGRANSERVLGKLAEIKDALVSRQQ